MQLPRIGRKWLAKPGIYLAGAALIATLAAAACSGEKPAPTATYDNKPAATATAYPTVEPPSPAATATPYPTATTEPAKPPEFRPLVNVDGKYDPNEWKDAKSIDYEWGKLLYKNDDKNLYMLADVIIDTGDDPAVGDGFEINIDVDNNGKGTKLVDRGYSLFRVNVPRNPSNTYKLGTYVNFSDHGSFLSTSAIMETNSVLGVGFGPTANSSIPHRFWELEIPRDELGANHANEMAVMIYLWSEEPKFDVGLSFAETFEGLQKIRTDSENYKALENR